MPDLFFFIFKMTHHVQFEQFKNVNVEKSIRLAQFGA